MGFKSHIYIYIYTYSILMVYIYIYIYVCVCVWLYDLLIGNQWDINGTHQNGGK